MGELAARRQWTGRLRLDVTSRRGWLPGTGGCIEAQLGRDLLVIRDGDRQVAVLDRDAFVGWLAHPVLPLRADDTEWVWRGHTMLLCIRCGGAPPRHLALSGQALQVLVSHLTVLA